jgi:hypothetical protein
MGMRGAGTWALWVGMLFGTSAVAAEPPQVELSEGNLPLGEIRPLDRRVYVVSLDGAWKQQPTTETHYHLAVKFPDGTIYTHRPMEDELFLRGEMRFMVPEHLLLRTNTTTGGKLQFFVTEPGAPGKTPTTISNPLELAWPVKRTAARPAPKAKATAPAPLDLPLDAGPLLPRD